MKGKKCHFKALNIPKFITYLFTGKQGCEINKIHKQIFKYSIGHLTNCF